MIEERIFNNRYRLDRKLGEGGMAIVYCGTRRATEEVTCSWARRYQGRVVERSPFLQALITAGLTEVAAPHAELVQEGDLVTELALASPSIGFVRTLGELGRAAAELREALVPWDPVAEGAATISPPLSISATSVGAWLACPRQYLAHLLGRRPGMRRRVIAGLAVGHEDEGDGRPRSNVQNNRPAGTDDFIIHVRGQYDDAVGRKIADQRRRQVRRLQHQPQPQRIAGPFGNDQAPAAAHYLFEKLLHHCRPL